MAGADTIIRIVVGTLAIVVFAFVTAVGFNLMDPIFQATGPPPGLGWGDGSNIMLFAGLGLIGMGLVVIIWMWVAPVRQDVRQDQRGPF